MTNLDIDSPKEQVLSELEEQKDTLCVKKKGRGRPRKKTTNNESNATVEPKKKRGRPKKNKPEVKLNPSEKASCTEKLDEPKKRRGRPKKSESAKITKTHSEPTKNENKEIITKEKTKEEKYFFLGLSIKDGLNISSYVENENKDFGQRIMKNNYTGPYDKKQLLEALKNYEASGFKIDPTIAERLGYNPIGA